MAFFQSKQVLANKALLEPRDAAGVVCSVTEFVIPAGFASGDIVEMTGLPANCIPVDVKLAAEDLDSATAMTIDAGILSGTYGTAPTVARTMGNEFFAADTVGQAGGVKAASKFAGYVMAPTTADRGIGLKFVAAGTIVAGAKARLFFSYIAAPAGV